MDQLIEYPTDKEIQLQRYIQSLHQELQVSHQTKLSLQEALDETNKQGMHVSSFKAIQSNTVSEHETNDHIYYTCT